jgi:hypothetical protein
MSKSLFLVASENRKSEPSLQIAFAAAWPKCLKIKANSAVSSRSTQGMMLYPNLSSVLDSAVGK